MSLPTTRVIASTVDEPPCDGRTDGQTDRLGGGAAAAGALLSISFSSCAEIIFVY